MYFCCIESWWIDRKNPAVGAISARLPSGTSAPSAATRVTRSPRALSSAATSLLRSRLYRYSVRPLAPVAPGRCGVCPVSTTMWAACAGSSAPKQSSALIRAPGKRLMNDDATPLATWKM